MPTIAIHPIATRRPLIPTPESLVGYIQDNWENRTPGDKPGIFHIEIPREWAYGDIITLQPGKIYKSKTSYSSRKGVNEDPRTETKILDTPPDPVAWADTIVYSRELLGGDVSSNSEFEVIAIRGLTETPNPRPLNTLLHDIFNQSGGTPTSGTAEEKLEMIRASFLFWKGRMMVG